MEINKTPRDHKLGQWGQEFVYIKMKVGWGYM